METRVVDQLTRRVEERYLGKIAWRVGLAIMGVLGIFALITGWSVYSTQQQTAQWITDYITSEFETPRIEATLQNVARTTSEEVVQAAILPEVALFKREVEGFKTSILSNIETATNETRQETKLFKHRVATLEHSIEADYLALQHELSVLKRRNELTTLADKAIANGARGSYDTLKQAVSKGRSTGNSALTAAALAEMLRVKSFYIGKTRLSGYRLGAKSSKGVSREENEIPSEQLISLVLNDPNWKVRAISANLLSTTNEFRVADALATCSSTDTNLDVLAACVKSFKNNTNAPLSDVFGESSLQKWWEQHRRAYEFDLSVAPKEEPKGKENYESRIAYQIYLEKEL